MRLINEIAYQERLAKIPMEERTFRKAVEVAEDMPTIDAVPRPSYRVPTKEEWRERYCTNRQIAGIRHRERKDGEG